MSVLLGNTWRVSVLGVVLSLVVLPSGTNAQEPKQTTRHVPVVEDLVQLLQARPDLRAALEGAIRTADLKGLPDMDSFLIYLDGLVTFVPTVQKLPTAREFYYIVNQAPGDQLNRDKSFNAWMKKYVKAAGQFLDTPASAVRIPSFTAQPNYHVDDYHRFHVPVAGEIKEVRNIHGRVYGDVIRRPDGTLYPVDGETYQIDQERGLIVIDSAEVGLVAVLPVGMCFVSSVNLTPEVGARLQKGDEFGFFLFGGSDIVMLFQNKKVVIDAEVGRKYLQGQRIGEIH